MPAPNKLGAVSSARDPTERTRGRSHRTTLVVVHGGAARRFDLPERGTLSIGRDDECDIRIDCPEVSRHHARVHVGRPFEVEDLGSANGTQLGSHSLPPHERFPVLENNSVRIGSALIVLHRDNASPEDSFDRPRARVDDAGVRPLARSAKMRDVLGTVERLAKHRTTVLLLGESGVGKGMLARHLHECSRRASGPFVAFDCASVPATLIGSVLFGAIKGVFTGATEDRAGIVEHADGGTLFLDEIGELPIELQPVLLRLLDRRESQRIGDRTFRPLDVRFVAATNQDLEEWIRDGRFREDLWFRISAGVIHVPPLRERTEDIAPIAEWMLERLRRDAGAEPLPRRISPAALEVLKTHSWRGNVRELFNVVERAAVLCGDADVLDTDHLPLDQLLSSVAEVRQPEAAGLDPFAALAKGWQQRASREERLRLLQLALETNGGSQVRAGALLHVSDVTIRAWMDEFGLPRPRARGK
ncbi:MAG: sigma 54-interacting transcriptional regulator [Deltaproteobacteria bacterium]